MGTLYVVATPIGNLEDITLRALRILREVKLIAAEDTRAARILLRHFEIHTPVTSYFEYSKLTKLDAIMASLQQGDVALISDAGMPGIADPGYALVQAALAQGVAVVPIPGPSALVTAVAVSGLPSDRFFFVGFLPRRRIERQRLLAGLAGAPGTIVAYEAPHRLLAALEDVLDVLGDRQMSAARELTKLFEEIRRGSVREVMAHFQAHPPRGEFTLVIAGKSDEPPVAPSEDRVRSRLAELAALGMPPAQAARIIAAETGLPRREVYQMAVRQ